VVVDAIAQETAAFGPPLPIQLDHSPVVLAAHPLLLEWNGFALRQERGQFTLELADDRGCHCCFSLTPVSQRVLIEDAGAPLLAPMAYASYPRLALQGRFGSTEVKGQAWFDHQWGEHGWFSLGQRGDRVLGWDWLGINLDQGYDLNIIIHRDMRTRQPIAQQAVLLVPGESPELIREVRVTPLRAWESPRTRISYPTSVQLSIPRLDAELVFEPLLEDQEIPFFGPVRAIWEGAGCVTGMMKGYRVAGCARLELFGYGYLLQLRHLLQPLADRVQQHIEHFLPRRLDSSSIERWVGLAQWEHEPEAQNVLLATPIWDLLDRKGKRWRPVFGLLMLEALGVASQEYEALLSVMLELHHTGSLIIDDIQDSSQLRRGEECIHLRYGTDIAISAANTVYFLPLLLIRDHPRLSEEQRLSIYEIVNRQFVRAHLGQAQDIYRALRLEKLDLDSPSFARLGGKILQGYAFKTGAVLAGAAEIACVIAGSSQPCRQACAAFARAFGTAFQIIDDVHNLGASRRWRKAPGEDIAEGKLTYLLYSTLKRLATPERLRLCNLLSCAEQRQQPERVTEAIALITSTQARAHCSDVAQTMVDEEWLTLSRFLPPSEPKQMLRVLCASLLHLEQR